MKPKQGEEQLGQVFLSTSLLDGRCDLKEKYAVKEIH